MRGLAVALLLSAPVACSTRSPAPDPAPRPGIPPRDATLSAPCARAAEDLRALAVEHPSALQLDGPGSDRLTRALAEVRSTCTPPEQQRLLGAELGTWLAVDSPG